MRVSSIYRGESIYEAKPELIHGKVVSVDVSSGLAIYKVIDNYGNIYKNVAVINSSGNNVGFTHTPIQINQSVVLISVSRNQPPYILGSIYKPPQIPFKPNDTQVSAEDDNDNITQLDYVVANGGNFINLSNKNGVTISANDVLRLQLKNAACKLRISAEGLDNDDNPLNGQAFIDALFAYLDELEQKVNANSEFASAAAPGVAAAYEAAALLADANIPGSGDALRDQSDACVDAATEAAVPLVNTSATTKSSCENTKNEKIILPQD